jgi:DNA repair exonuclease SbcCD ATPase subunit
MNRIELLRQRFEQERGRKLQVAQSLQDRKDGLKQKKRDLRKHEIAREIIREVGIKTQEQLSYHISDITSLALEAVFDDPYELLVEFVQRRNKTECDLLFSRDDNKIDPISASGGGAVDVASFALRIAAWSMASPKTRNTIILDEPLRFLSQDKQERASKMLKELSDKLGLQFIIITHEDTLTEYADKTFTIRKKKGVSHIM